MSLFKGKYKTNSNRLKDWDYSNEAIYFITIVCENRECIFGNVENNKMILNSSGQIIKNELFKSVEIRNNWIFHIWVIMPNHIHLLVEIIKSHDVETHDVEAHSSAFLESQNNNVNTHDVETHCGASLRHDLPKKLTRKPNSISSFVDIFKSVTTKQIVDLRRDAPCRDAQQCVSTGKIWQSNYHDHIVSNYNSFEMIHQYISNNPGNWENDSINSK